MGILDKIKESASQLKLTYLGGHPDIPRSMIVYVGREGDNLNLFRMGKTIASIPLSSVKSTRLERADSRSLGKAAVGAVAGGVLMGPLGMIAGGAFGGRKRNESVIVVTVQHGSTELQILFGDVGSRYPKFVNLLK